MKVLHLSTHDITGGAARAAYRLHRGLLECGHESRMLVLGKTSEDPTVDAFSPSRGLLDRTRRRLRRERVLRDRARYRRTRPPGFEQFSDDRTEYAGEIVESMGPCNVLNLHWVAGFTDLGTLFGRLPRDLPVVWTLHDMNAFTGGCHYDAECGRFTGSCGACPQLGSGQEQDLSREVWDRKREAFGKMGGRLHLVADSTWLAGEARRSSLVGKFPVTTIHYALDTEVFSPVDVGVARQTLGIPDDATVLLFVADSVENRRKGFQYLTAALERLVGSPGLFVVSIGRGSAPVAASLPHLHLENIRDDKFLALVYGAADLFVIPSIQEAYGQTVLEAMACGTPSVGFAVGGIPDVIRAGETGLLATPADTEDLVRALSSLLDDRETRARMGREGRRIAVEEHSLSVQAGHYATLYQRLTGAD